MYSLIFCIITCLALRPEGIAQSYTLRQFQQQIWDQANEMPSFYTLQAAQAEGEMAKRAGLPQVTLVGEPLNLIRQNVLRYNALIDADEYRNQQLLRNSLDLRIEQRIGALGGVLSVQSGLSRLLSTTGPTTVLNYEITPVSVRWTQDFANIGNVAREQRALALSLDLEQKGYLSDIAEQVKTVSLVYLDAWSLQAGIASTKLRLAQRDTLMTIVDRQLEKGFSDLAQRLLLEQLMLEDSLLLIDQLDQFEDACYQLFQRGMFLPTADDWRLEQPDLPSSLSIPTQDAGARRNPFREASAQMELFSLEREVLARERGALPQVTIAGGIGTNRLSNEPWWAATDPFIPQQYVNIQVNIPIWNWGMNQMKVQQGSWLVMARQMTYEQNMREESQQINQFIHAYNRVIPKLDILRRLEEIREDQYQLTLQKWSLGQSSIQEFYEATQQWKQSEQQYVALLRDAWNSYLSLQSILLVDPATLAPFSATEE